MKVQLITTRATQSTSTHWVHIFTLWRPDIHDAIRTWTHHERDLQMTTCTPNLPQKASIPTPRAFARSPNERIASCTQCAEIVVNIHLSKFTATIDGKQDTRLGKCCAKVTVSTSTVSVCAATNSATSRRAVMYTIRQHPASLTTGLAAKCRRKNDR